MFHHKSKGKGRKGDSLSSSQSRSGTFVDLFAVMVLLNFYLDVLTHYYFTTSFDIFYCCFCLQGTSTSRHRQEAFLVALHDEGEQQMAGAWLTWPGVRAAQQEAPEKPYVGVTQQEAPEEPDVGVTHQEAPEQPDVEDEVDDQPHATYRLHQFQFTFNIFYIIK
jgi:hypothetical protein